MSLDRSRRRRDARGIPDAERDVASNAESTLQQVGNVARALAAGSDVSWTGAGNYSRVPQRTPATYIATLWLGPAPVR
jgi:hypothetical protein